VAVAQGLKKLAKPFDTGALVCEDIGGELP
jgi:hypothetical protein